MTRQPEEKGEKPGDQCAHRRNRCLNEFELIRKYRCEACGAVMMCACDETVGRKFLAHQLNHSVELDTQRKVPVTAGFKPGTQGYGRRRAKAIKKHLSQVMCERGDLQWLFDYWLGPSEGLRQYLWAHREEHIQEARQLIDILPPAAVIEILRYLVEDYWGRYSGWPDLLVHRGNQFFFAEIKSSGDKLGEKQKHWIRSNHKRLHFPFKLVKVHKVATATV